MIRAAGLLGSGNPSRDVSKAIEALGAPAPYELGQFGGGILSLALYPVYVRAEVYRAARQSAAAAAEFQKILDHPGAVQNEPIGALAHLGLGRAYALEAGIPGRAGSQARPFGVPAASGKQQTAGKMPALPGDALDKARIAYQDFFALWKDADRDIPILKQAKAEYAKLQ